MKLPTGLFLLAAMLSACFWARESDAVPGSEKPLIGTWVGGTTVTRNGTPIQVYLRLRIDANHTYVSGESASIPALQMRSKVFEESGSWAQDSGRFRALPGKCAGIIDPERGRFGPVACGEENAISGRVSGDTLSIDRLIQGKAFSFTLNRIKASE